MEGWIRIHRKVKDHWLWKSDHRLKWWLDILLTVNYTDTKVLIKGSLIDCKRGQSVRSLETWAREWNVTKKTVKEFFELLQKDSMLVYESIQISTRITVCNYDGYQDIVNGAETQSKRKVNGAYTETTPKQEGEEGIKKKKKVKNVFTPPQLSDVVLYFTESGYTEESAKKAFNYYSVMNWVDSKGNQVNNWKGKMLSVWFRPENINKINNDDLEYQLLNEKLYGKPV